MVQKSRIRIRSSQFRDIQDSQARLERITDSSYLGVPCSDESESKLLNDLMVSAQPTKKWQAKISTQFHSSTANAADDKISLETLVEKTL